MVGRGLRRAQSSRSVRAGFWRPALAFPLRKPRWLAHDQKQTGGQNTDRHLQRAETMRGFRLHFSDFGESHDHRDPACLCDRRPVRVRCRRNGLVELREAELH